ncbi:hypothetical protein [Cetobacterium sp.]|uniref:hypothetical protein n=1 Tax=Cetobacterium sp. TaxID=2071632 RepID=UPI003F2EE0D4
MSKIFNLFKKKELEEITEDKNKAIEIQNKTANIKSAYGKNKSVFDNIYSHYFTGENARSYYMTQCMDTLVEDIKKELLEQPLLARVIKNISNSVIKDGISFKGETVRDLAKEKRVQDRFYKILKDSDYLDTDFIEECILNLVKYSNVFIIPKRDKNEKLINVLVTQNIGWKVDEAIGTCYAIKYLFFNKKYKNQWDIWHYTFNKESDEIFGLPIWGSVIPYLRKYNFLISSSIDSYSDQSIEKTIYEVGITNNGTVRPVTPKAYNSIRNNLTDDPTADLITDVPINVKTISKTFTSPDKILDVLELQIIAGLYTSESQLGQNGAGRQDAEAQKDNTDAIVNDFQTALAKHLNKTFIKEICKDLFGDNDEANDIRLVFNSGFDKQERKEKHEVFKFQSGVADLNEVRKVMGYEGEIQASKTFFKLYQQTEMNGSVASKNSPSNQHTSGTNTTKKTKKN